MELGIGVFPRDQAEIVGQRTLEDVALLGQQASGSTHARHSANAGEKAGSFDPGAAVPSLRFDARGELLIYMTSDGQVRWRDIAGEDTTLKPGGYLAAAW